MERYCLARRGRNSALINKLVTEIGHTSERRAGGPEAMEPSLSPILLGQKKAGKPNTRIVWPG